MSVIAITAFNHTIVLDIDNKSESPVQYITFQVVLMFLSEASSLEISARGR
jgi:hypothetical protein